MWPFRTKAKRPSRTPPSVPFVDGVAWVAGLGGATSTVSAQSSEGLAAVLAAVNAVACTIGSLPAYVTRADDSRAEVPDHPLQRLIDDGVNGSESWSDFVEGMLASCLLRGNFVAELGIDARGELRSLTTLPWQNIVPWVDDAGELLFDYLPTLPPNAGKRRRLLRDEVLFVKDRSDDGVVGRSRISRASASMQSALELQRSSTQFFGNMSRPAGAITSPGRVSDDVAKRLAEDWDNNYRGNGLGKTAVLPQGMTWERLSLLTPEDAQLILHKQFAVADVARLFGVPPFMLADPSRSTFASAREATRHFAMTTLAPWCHRIERAFRQSVLGTGYALKIDLDSLIKADVGELYAALLKARQGGWISPNDAREETGWPRVDGGDSIEPPVAGGRPADALPPDDTTGKIVDIGRRA